MVLRNGHGVEIGTTRRVRVSMSFFPSKETTAIAGVQLRVSIEA